MTGDPRTVHLPGGALRYSLRRPAASRGIRVTLDPERGVLVSVPPATRRGWARPDDRIEAFLAHREAWIRRHLARHERQLAELSDRGPLAAGGEVRYLGDLHRVRVEVAPSSERRSLVERRVGPGGRMLLVHRATPDRRSLPAVLRDWSRGRADELIRAAAAEHAAPLGVEPAAITIRDPRTRWGSAARSGRLSFSWRLVLAPPEALETVVVHELAHLRVFGHGPRFWSLVETRRPDHPVWRRWLRDHSLELHRSLADEAVG
jgi:predicted metal-dependent hydrolase